MIHTSKNVDKVFAFLSQNLIIEDFIAWRFFLSWIPIGCVKADSQLLVVEYLIIW